MTFQRAEKAFGETLLCLTCLGRVGVGTSGSSGDALLEHWNL